MLCVWLKSVGCGLRGGREDAVEAEIEGLGGVVIGPGAGEDQDDGGAGEGSAVEEGDGVGEMRIVEFSERSGAEIERLLDGGDQFVFGVGFGELGGFGGGDAGNFGAEEIVGVRDVQSE